MIKSSCSPLLAIAQILSFIATIAILSGCHPADPQLVHSGVDAIQVVQLLDKSQVASERERAVREMETDRRAGFDWNYFWSSMGRNGRMRRLSPDQQERIFKLGGQSCAGSSFELFAEMILKLETGYNFIVGKDRACAQPLSEKLLAQYVQHYSNKTWPKNSVGAQALKPQGSIEYSVGLTDLIISEYELRSAGSRLSLLHLLTNDQWYGLIERLLQTGQGHLAAQVVQITQREFGGLQFLDSLIISWLEHPDAFQDIIDKNDLIDMANLLTSDTQLRVRSQGVPSNTWSVVFNTLSQKFLTTSARKLADIDGFSTQLKVLHLLQDVPTNIAQAPSFSEQLLWFEKMLRGLEDNLAGNPYALAWMNTASSDSLVLWLRQRRGIEWNSQDRDQISRMIATSPLEEALLRKLRLQTLGSATEIQTAFKDYCAWLNTKGIASRSVDGKDFQWNLTASPGCVEVTGNQLPSDVIEAQSPNKISMSFDSVLITGGWNIKLQVPSFDGSFIDLSTRLTHPDLPVEPAPVEDNALTFPVLLGLGIDSNQVLQGQGIYYFVYHFTQKFAQPGRQSTRQPSPGFSGGKLELLVKKNEPQHLPVFVALGGQGQRATPPRPGGLASESRVSWGPLSLSLLRARGFDDSPASQPIALPNPTFAVLAELLKNARTENGTIKVYIEPQRLTLNLTEKQRATVDSVCPVNAQQMICWQNISLQAIRDLSARFRQYCPEQNGSPQCSAATQTKILDRLNSNIFVEPAGAIGPTNFDGIPGGRGSLNVKEQL